MKQNNFFTSLSPLARTTLIICLIALPILVISAVFIVLTLANDKSNDTNKVALNPTNTITPSFTYSSNPTVPAVTHTVSPTTDPYAGWKDYYNPDYDLNFKFPFDYKVEVNTKNIDCDSAVNVMKLTDCSNTKPQIIKTFSVKFNNNESVFYFEPVYGPIGGKDCENKIQSFNFVFFASNYNHAICVNTTDNSFSSNYTNGIKINTKKGNYSQIRFMISGSKVEQLKDFNQILRNIK